MRFLFATILILNCFSVYSQDYDKELRKAYTRKSTELLNNLLIDWNNESRKLVDERNESLTKYDNLIESFYSLNHVKKLSSNDYIIFDYRDFIIEIFKENSELEKEITNIMDSIFVISTIDLNSLKTDSIFFEEYKYERSIVSKDSNSNYYPREIDGRTLLLTDDYSNLITRFLRGKGDDYKKKEFLRKRISGFYQDGRSFSMNKKIKKIFLSSSQELAIIDWADGYCWGQEVYLFYSGKWERINKLIEICE